MKHKKPGPPLPAAEPSDSVDGHSAAIMLGLVRIDPELGWVRGPAGETRLMPGTMNVLVYLLEHAPRVVSADELLDTFWAGRVVDSSTIHRRINQIRRALGDNPRDPTLIATVPKRGYRIIGEVCRLRQHESGDVMQNLSVSSDADSPRSSGPMPFIGRHDTCLRFEHRLRAARAGQSCIVFLSGPPGIGKTRCATELLERAQRSGFEACSTWCDELVINAPLWPWINLVRTLAEANRLATLRPDLDHQLAVLCELVPELIGRFPDLPPIPILPANARAVRIQDAIAALVRRLASENPVILLIDDLHNADRASLDVLESLARSTSGDGVVMLFTARSTELNRQHPLNKTVATLTRHCALERENLEGLTGIDLNRLIACFTEAPDRYAATIAEKTDGNPLYASLLARSLASGESPEASASLREVIFGNLARLSERCWQSISAAAVVGHEFTAELIGTLTGKDQASTNAALQEARRAGVVGGDDRFAHILIQEAVYEEIPAAERRHFHAAIANRLASRPTELLDIGAITRIARHYTLGSQPLEAADWYRMANSRLAGSHDRQAYECSRLALKTLETYFATEPTEALAGEIVRSTIGAIHVAGRAMIPKEQVHAHYLHAGRIASSLENGAAQLCLLKTVYSDYLLLSGQSADEALRWAEDAFTVGQQCGDDGIRLHASITLMNRYETLNRDAEAYEIAKRELDAPPADPLASFGDGRWPAFPRILVAAARRQAVLGDPTGALDRIQNALDLLKKDRRSIAPEKIEMEVDATAYLCGPMHLLEAIHAAGICYGYLGAVRRLTRCGAHLRDWTREYQALFRLHGHRLLALQLRLERRWQELADIAHLLPEDCSEHATDPFLVALRALALSNLGEYEQSEELVFALLNNGAPASLQASIYAAGALIRSASPRAVTSAMRLADDTEESIDRSGAEGDRPHLLELRAQIGRVTGNELVCQRMQNAAQALWLKIGAPAQVARMIEELETLSPREGTEYFSAF